MPDQPVATAAADAGAARRRVSLWPLLLAAWPALFLYGQNAAEVRPLEALTVTALAVGVAAILLVALTLGLRDRDRAALIVGVLAITLTVEGHVANLVGDPAGMHAFWIGGALLLIAGIFGLGRRARDVARIAAGVSATLVVVAVAPALPALTATSARVAQAAPEDSGVEAVDSAAVGDWVGAGEPRDIYYLIFDRYGSEQSLRRRFGWNNAPFTRALEQRGFFVADEATANHLRTAESLASSLNLRYLLDMEQRYGPDTGNLLPVYDMLQNHTVGKVLKERGYRYAHVGAWWDPTQHNDYADYNFGFERKSDFVETFWDSTLIERIRPQPLLTGERKRQGAYRGTLDQLRQIRRASRLDGPTFTFAHLLIPHQPFVFDRNGDYVSLERDGERGHDRGYVEQLEWTNQQIVALVEDLLDVPDDRKPIIIVQADEGPHPLRFLAQQETFDWHRASDDELREKLAILSAYFLPDVDGVEEPQLYDSISPVNTWRMVFNGYFGADLPLVEDRSYVFGDESRVYDFEDVTERLR